MVLLVLSFFGKSLLTVRKIPYTYKVPWWQTIAMKANLLPNVLNILAIPFQENKLISTVYYGGIFVSLHTRSVWDTICDTGGRSTVKLSLSKSHRIPYSWQRIPLPQLELLMMGLRTSVLSLQRIDPPPSKNWNFSWRTVWGIRMWRLMAVSPADIFSLWKVA